jgi:ParB-like chromosome segregation protein Spo0J
MSIHNDYLINMSPLLDSRLSYFESIIQRLEEKLIKIEKDISDRMASTIRHNRARGKHEVELQASLVGMLKDGWDELKIMKELGMTLEEVQRLIGLKGIASEIKGVPYSIERQIVEVEEDIKPWEEQQ